MSRISPNLLQFAFHRGLSNKWPGFAIKYPFFIVTICLVIAVVGVTTVARMPVDLFPDINIPVVVVATFYSGMPPEQIEANITNPFERFFTLASGIDHIESRSLTGVSLIKIYFQAGTNPDAAVSGISNLAMAQLRRLPPGHVAARSAEIRCIEFAGVLDYAKGSRAKRNPDCMTSTSLMFATRLRMCRVHRCLSLSAASTGRFRFMWTR